MANDLTVSEIERQNILNNPFALEEIQSNVGVFTPFVTMARPL